MLEIICMVIGALVIGLCAGYSIVYCIIKGYENIKKHYIIYNEYKGLTVYQVIDILNNNKGRGYNE